MKTTTVWKNDQHFTGHQEGNSNPIELDGSGQKGFAPKATLLSALAACSGIDVVETLKKMRVDFSDLKIEVESEQTNEHPKVFRDIFITFKMKTEAANEDKVRKAIDLSLEKYCGVAAMLKKNSAISYQLEIKNS
ncbi:MAG: osmotically inducible protein C [Chitinophagaceae bacterium]